MMRSRPTPGTRRAPPPEPIHPRRGRLVYAAGGHAFHPTFLPRQRTLDLTIPRPPVSAHEGHLVRALAEDENALRDCLTGDIPVDRHRLRCALVRRAQGLDLELEAANRRALAGAAAHWMLLRHTLGEVGRAIGEAGVDWVPIKGCDLARRAYPVDVDRPSSDMDVLVRPNDFDLARKALLARGWRSVHDHPTVERYRVEEGYAWQATRDGGPLLEVHHRLWGLIPNGYETILVDDAPAASRAPAWHDAYLLAATHHWLNPPPRALLGWWDLERITQSAHDDDAFTTRVAERAITWQVQLPLALAALMANALWPGGAHEAIATRVLPTLRAPERAVVARLVTNGPDAISTPRVVLARLLAGRSSRGGWRVVPRRIWAHAGVVYQETSSEWAWPRRRLTHVLRRLGLATDP